MPGSVDTPLSGGTIQKGDADVPFLLGSRRFPDLPPRVKRALLLAQAVGISSVPARIRKRPGDANRVLASGSVNP